MAQIVDGATVEELLRRDVETAERAVPRLIRAPLEDGRFDALCSFAFNLGAGALQSSTLLKRVNGEERNDGPYQFGRWANAEGDGPAPRLRRVAR